MPESNFEIAQLVTQEDADAVMFELQDLPCVHQAEVDLVKGRAWVSHTPHDFSRRHCRGARRCRLQRQASGTMKPRCRVFIMRQNAVKT